MILAVGTLLLGFALLLKGADWLVEGSCAIAERAGVSQLIIGLTFVSFGTSLPEFFVNIASRAGGDAGITVGNILGSNIANILLILGLSAVIQPLVIRKSTLVWEIPFALTAAVTLAVLAHHQGADIGSFHGLTRPDGLILLALFATFLFYIHRLRKSDAAHKIDLPCRPSQLKRSVLMVSAGIPALAIGSRWVVEEAAAIASALGVAEGVVGLTVVAVGTTLPELATSLTASLKKRPDIAVGNVIGSNIFNISWILGISALVSPLPIPRGFMFDIGVIIFVTAILFLSASFRGRGVIGRWTGVFFVLLYAAYVASSVFRSSGF
jgi:cation:H+ antiporter